MGKTRRQHFIPISYLERFTSKDELYTIDIVERKTFKTSPVNVAHIRDFYTVELEDESKENIVEEYFSQVEGNAKPILDRWIKTMKPPTQKEWHIISEFIAGMSLRIPEFRKKYLEMRQYMLDLTNHFSLSSKEAYEKTRERYHQDTGKELELGYEEMKHAVENPAQYQIILHQNEYISTMMKCLPEIASIIFKMTPLLFVATGE